MYTVHGSKTQNLLCNKKYINWVNHKLQRIIQYQGSVWTAKMRLNTTKRTQGFQLGGAGQPMVHWRNMSCTGVLH